MNIRAKPVLRGRWSELPVRKLIRVVQFGEVAAGNFQQNWPGQNDRQQKHQIPRTQNGDAVFFESPPRALAGRGVQLRVASCELSAGSCGFGCLSLNAQL